MTLNGRRAKAAGVDLVHRLPEVINRRTLRDAEDIGAVLVSRLAKETRAALAAQSTDGSGFIVGLVPVADGPMPRDFAEALVQRQEAIESRTLSIVHAALAGREPWTRRLGPPPADKSALNRWLKEACTVAAYRDRYQRQSDGAERVGCSLQQRRDRDRAAQACISAQTIATAASTPAIRSAAGDVAARRWRQ